jgi:hypothetical protein
MTVANKRLFPFGREAGGEGRGDRSTLFPY